MSRGRQAGAWVGWTVMLAAATLVMRLLRGEVDQTHAALIYLLIVLGASVGGGRLLGLGLACLAFLLIDYFFQPPYDTLAIGRLDWTVLITFLATAGVATELLAEVQGEARAARRRADEVESLSRLAAQTLNAPHAEDALTGFAAVIHRTLGVRECEIRQFEPDGSSSGVTAGAARPASAESDRGCMRLVAESGLARVRRKDGSVVVGRSAANGIDPAVFEVPEADTLYLPLQGATRIVGVLRISGADGVAFDAAKRSFLTALAYYTALGVERVHLIAEAAHAEALREADRMKDVLLASISHDLRTPLTTIMALAQEAAGRGDESARVIEQQADRLSHLVADVLDLSRIKGGVLRVTPELNTAEDLLGTAVRSLAPDAEARTVEIALDMDRPALVGTFDFVQSLRILSNLLENALRHTPPGGSVQVSAEREGGMLVFTVADRGPGVAPAERERIFEPFYRPSEEPPDTGRAGLGLAIARQLAELQGGQVSFSPRPGGGSLFRLHLPAADLDEASLADS